jgi:hypothetical protein
MPESNASEEIHIPAIPKETAGAVAGAAIGSVAGPVGAVVGGVFGALAGKAAAGGKPILPAARGCNQKGQAQEGFEPKEKTLSQ